MKRLNNIFVLLIILLIVSCSGLYEGNLKVRDRITYELINNILSDTSDTFFNKPYFISERPVLNPPIMNGFNNEKDFLLDLFKENDSLNLFTQFRKRKDFLLDSSKISNAKLVPKKYFIKNNKQKSLWDIIDTKFDGGFYIIGMPFFSSDNTLVYIRIGYLCGPLCGSGHSRLYKFENGEWNLIKKFESWIS